MLLSYAWLKTYLPKLPTPLALADVMMLHGLDVESVTTGSERFDRVVVGQIVGIKPHPNADKLRLAEVLIEPNGEPQEIVCGAPNIEVGQKVPVALLGAKLPNGLTIEPRAIRGVVSNGMLCAEDELGLGTSHAGIMVLEPDLKVGTPLAEVQGKTDAVIDVTTPANRADLMSVRGLAREIGAMLGETVTFREPDVTESSARAAKSITLDVASAKASPFFSTRVIRGVRHQPTPPHIVERLRAAGMRPINAIVDCTNYVMLDYGQPLHAYDAAKLVGGALHVRFAKDNEQLTTLDGKSRTMTPDMIVIADDNGSVGIAGVMGGRSTEVSTATTDIVLEAAMFDPVAIRKTSRRLGLVSEASKRFEKGLWPELTVEALDAAAAMIVSVCGGTTEQGIVKTGKASSSKRTVKIAPAYISERLGQKIPAAEAKKILERLGFAVKGTAKYWTVSVPAWRTDVALPEDIVDEVGRMVGYADVPSQMPSAAKAKELPPMIRFQEDVKNILVDMGCTEIISHAFYGEKSSTLVKGEHFEVKNPLDSTQHKLRKSLLPQIEEILKNQADAGEDAKIFEVGLVFDPTLPGPIDRQQYWNLAVGVAHKGESEINSIIAEIQKKLDATVQPMTKRSIEGLVRGRQLEVCEFILKDLRSGSMAHFDEWDPERHIKRNVHYREPSKYPPITRDVSFWWTKSPAELTEVLTDFQRAHPLLWDTATKDTFTKDGKTSFLISFVYQSPERTLTKTEIDAMMGRLEKVLAENGATIR